MTELLNGDPFPVKDRPFLQRLKETTASRHRLLETQALLHALLTPQVTLEQYRDYLLRMQKITGAYENNVLPMLSQSAFAPKRPLSFLLEADLRTLPPPVHPVAPLSDFFLPENFSLPFAWGFAYVMEGSKLGGKVIAKHLLKTLGVDQANGASYLSNTGADTGLEWKEFLNCLSAYAATGVEETIISGAVFGFSSVHQYFDTNGQTHAD